jgi:DNA/RNA-binding domain of Phe-tRNA-synthetase-like protein
MWQDGGVSDFPPATRHELEGWCLFWAALRPRPGAAAALAALRREVATRARASHTLERLPQHPTVAALRRLYRQAGCDPTRYRPSSEALLRRLLKGEELPEIHPLVDLNNCLSAELAVPACVMDVRYLSPPFVFRAGRAGEAYQSLRGPFNLEGKPLLVDEQGPCDTPITGGVRVKVRDDSHDVWLVAYMPAAVVSPACARQALAMLLEEAPVAELVAQGATGDSGETSPHRS